MTSGTSALKITQESFSQSHSYSVPQESFDQFHSDSAFSEGKSAFSKSKDSIIPTDLKIRASYKREIPKKQDQYKLITKEDIFYYIYGLLHSEDYREKYKSNLDKDLPHIPLVPEFWEFSSIGRKLADLHLNYENQAPLEQIKILKRGKEINISTLINHSQNRATPCFADRVDLSPDYIGDQKETSCIIQQKNIKQDSNKKEKIRVSSIQDQYILPKDLNSEDLKVQKMKYKKEDKTKIQFNDRLTIQDQYILPKDLNSEDLKVQKMKYKKEDKTEIQFNDYITISNIPKEAWDYKINGWSAPKWIVERYQYKKDKKTDLVNDPNTYSEDPAYVLKLLLSVITVSLKTQELVKSLPSIDFDKLISSQKTA